MRTARRVVAVITALLATTSGGLPAAHASGMADVPAYGSITITDPGTGPRESWTYDGVLDCTTYTRGPSGAPQSIKVTCNVSQGVISDLDCPLMVVSRWTQSVVGARATCATTLDMGVGTSGMAEANLGHVYDAITCEAYVNVGVLVPPYSVTCDEPGLPGDSP
jgi:hypothetical protein